MTYLLPDKVYKLMKWFALIALPAVAVLYQALAATWGLPYGGEVATTCSAVAVFIGALIGVSQATAKEG